MKKKRSRKESARESKLALKIEKNPESLTRFDLQCVEFRRQLTISTRIHAHYFLDDNGDDEGNDTVKRLLRSFIGTSLHFPESTHKLQDL